MYLLAPSFLQNLKKILRSDPELWDVQFFGPKWPICHEQNFFGTNHYYYFHLPIALLIVQNLKKFLQRIQSYQDVPFLGKKWPICPQKIFFWKIIIMTLIYLLAPFIVQNFEKPLPADSEFWGCTIFRPKRAHFPKWDFFFKKPLNEPCFFHSCISTGQKSKSDINLLPKYWRLKNTEISLVERHFWL